MTLLMASVSNIEHAKQKNQRACVLWFTGLSGAGKSATANAVELKLFELGLHTYLLDGDDLRLGLNKDLGFSDEDRLENIRRVGELAKLFTDAGLIVLASFISPFRKDRLMVRQLVADVPFVEIFVDTPLSVCEGRDPKGLYKKARNGEIANFTGISSTYEAPLSPELVINTSRFTVDDCAEQVLIYMSDQKILRNDSQ
jgi:adenylylsulfate kinase